MNQKQQQGQWLNVAFSMWLIPDNIKENIEETEAKWHRVTLKIINYTHQEATILNMYMRNI